jgi:hypothetical protein
LHGKARCLPWVICWSHRGRTSRKSK